MNVSKNIWSRLAIPHPSCSVLIPTSLWVKSCDTTIMCMMHVLIVYQLLGRSDCWPWSSLDLHDIQSP